MAAKRISTECCRIANYCCTGHQYHFFPTSSIGTVMLLEQNVLSLGKLICSEKPREIYHHSLLPEMLSHGQINFGLSLHSIKLSFAIWHQHRTSKIKHPSVFYSNQLLKISSSTWLLPTGSPNYFWAVSSLHEKLSFAIWLAAATMVKSKIAPGPPIRPWRRRAASTSTRNELSLRHSSLPGAAPLLWPWQESR